MSDDEKSPEIKTSGINELKIVNELMEEIKKDHSEIIEGINLARESILVSIRIIKLLREELTVTNDLLRNKDSKIKRLDPSTQNIILEELNRIGVLYKTNIIRVLNVDEKYALDIMKKMSAMENGPVFIPGCGAKSSRLISNDNETVVLARKFIEIVHREKDITSKKLLDELGEPNWNLPEIIRMAKELGGRFVLEGDNIREEGVC